MTFKKGSEWQGNRQGRPVNSGHRQKLFMTLVEPHREKLFETAINLALAGNEPMLRLFLERMLPAKPTDDEIAIEAQKLDGKTTSALLDVGDSILNAVAQGQITPEQGSSLMGVINSQRQTIETCEINLRIKEIERTLKQRKSSKKEK